MILIYLVAALGFTSDVGVSAHVTKVPSNTSAKAFATRLIEHSGMATSERDHRFSGVVPSGLNSIALRADDGRSIYVYFRGKTGRKGVVCVLRKDSKVFNEAVSNAKAAAFNWCQAFMGLKPQLLPRIGVTPIRKIRSAAGRKQA